MQTSKTLEKIPLGEERSLLPQGQGLWWIGTGFLESKLVKTSLRPSLFSFTSDALLLSYTGNRNNHRYWSRAPHTYSLSWVLSSTYNSFSSLVLLQKTTKRLMNSRSSGGFRLNQKDFSARNYLGHPDRLLHTRRQAQRRVKWSRTHGK